MTRTALTLLDDAASQPGLVKAHIRMEAALLRAMVDEVGRRHPADPEIVPLRGQLAEEVERVTELLRSSYETDGVACAPITVLVVDDDAAALSATCAALRQLGYACRGVRDGEEALAEFDREPVAIVLSDFAMPGMTGVELCVELHRRAQTPYFVLATAFHDKEEILQAAKDHVDDFLCKPIDIGELEARLSAAVRLLRAMVGLYGVPG